MIAEIRHTATQIFLAMDRDSAIVFMTHLQFAVKHFEEVFKDEPNPSASVVFCRAIAEQLGEKMIANWPDLIFVVQHGWKQDTEFQAWAAEVALFIPNFYSKVSIIEARDLYLQDYSPEVSAEILIKRINRKNAKGGDKPPPKKG